MLKATSPYSRRRFFRQRWTVLSICLTKAGSAAQSVMDALRFEPPSQCSARTTCCCVVPNWHCLCYVLFLFVNDSHFQRARCHADAYAVLQQLNQCPPQCIQGDKPSVWSDALASQPLRLQRSNNYMLGLATANIIKYVFRNAKINKSKLLGRSLPT